MRRTQLPLGKHHRRGTVLLVVLIVVLLIVGMAGSLFRLSLGPVEVLSRVITSETRPGFRRLETHVRLEPGFAHTPAHGYDTRTVGPSQNPRQDTP